MTTTSSSDEVTVDALQQKIFLLEQGLKQSAHLRELWTNAVRELKATRAELRRSLERLTEAHEQLEQKSVSLERLNQHLSEEMELRERMETELRLAQKLESIGQLAAGLAHEINTPIQYIGDNTRYLGTDFDACLALFDQLRPILDENADPAILLDRARQIVETEDLAGLAEDVPDALTETLEGIEQVAEIVSSMKEFSHHGTQGKTPVDINRALQVTATVARSEWKDVAEIEWQLAELPDVYAVGAELNQVFLNLLVNAAQAVAEAAKKRTSPPGVIKITTAVAAGGVSVEVTDNGIGVPDDVKEHIFDLFFSTKDVGVGTGQGLSIARSIVVDRHNGTIDMVSEPGVETSFVIWLPIGCG